MDKKIKIIDLFCLISNGEEVPKHIRIYSEDWYWNNYDGYVTKESLKTTPDAQIYLFDRYRIAFALNNEAEIIDDEEDKDIPLIPDDKLYDMSNVENYKSYEKLAYNFKVLHEKINQVVKEFNEYRKENE